MVDEVDPDRVVSVGEKGNLELCAYSVRTRHKDRLSVLARVELKQTAEGPDVREHTRGKRLPCEVLDVAYHFIRRVDIHP